MSLDSSPKGPAVASGSALVLAVLAAGQFLMTLDSSVMNVSMATVAADVGTTITGIQTAITLYTLVMASLMITGGKIGTILGRRRAFGLGLIIYGAGSFVTGIAPNLTVLLIGWSLLEGIGAALIMPAIVSLVAANFPAERRPAAYGLVAAAGAAAVAVGPLLGGAVTTFASWRYVFFGEVVIVVLILLALRRVEDIPPQRIRLDLVGSLLSVAGLGMFVYGVLRSSEWGWIQTKPGGPAILGLSPVIWLLLGGLFVLYLFLRRETYLAKTGGEPLVDPALLRNSQLTGGLSMFFAQFLIQAGVFFSVPLFLSVVLELSALETGVRILPLSIALVLAAVGIPKLRPQANPRRIVRIGLGIMVVGILILVGGMDPGANAAVVSIPMLLMGLGLGALASQLGAVTVSAVPDSQSAEVGGLQNTATNLGASLGTALIGSILIATLTTSVIAGIENNPAVPESVQQQATTDMAAGVPFLSDTQLEGALDEAGVDEATADAILEVNSDARLEALQVAFAVTALITVAALFGTGSLPRRPVGARPGEGQRRPDETDDER
ncbi:MFS transporter [Rhodococcus aetherivorans]|uniref:Multidrug transporter, MFS superfamily n=1 Tax=Rhodococcus aetherivorans TaxID=191292 RepID=A0ABQ0YKQ9_9NOCA|nr:MULTISPECIES: MFS transporter [Rhodococcus]ETT27440.1 major facilitator superfamily MFS_1 [Rhodococcus rhodochrous ATCC 21198]NCL76261.1 Multidrug resistance protein Stp [Rhodococcus sp. YH1]AKE88061.1 MFS transporter [Rhodococcus aetherivorans]MDV6295400.1 MFS transporter [Rhodococcus aetherivorans]NGP28204.1 MFS transporter [Rhodococcus aetherivorans]